MLQKKIRCTAKIKDGALLEKTNEAAYWLGFLMADGSVSSSSNEIKLKLWAKDFEHIQKFGAYLGLPSARCRVYRKEALVTFSDKHVKNALTSYGIGPQKTFLAEVKSPHLIKNRFFWAGFIDGDGSLGQYSPNENQIRFSISAVSGSLKIMNQFKDFIFAETKISLKISTVQKENPNYVFNLGGKKAVRAMQLLYADNQYALPRKAEIAKKAAVRYESILDGAAINWETATGHDYIWFEKNPRVKNKKYRVVGPHELNIGNFSTIEIALTALDFFFDLTFQGISDQEAKKIVLQRFEEYFPKSYYSKDSAIGYDKKRQKYICKLYYQTQIPGEKGKDVYILEHCNKKLVQAVNMIAKRLREVGYKYEGRRSRIAQGNFLYESSIPNNWKNTLIAGGLASTIINGLEDCINDAWTELGQNTTVMEN